MKKISSIFAVLAATAGLYISCTDLSQIEKDIESLDSRVTAFENQMKTVNDEIAALGKLEAATTISSVTPDGKGGFTIKFADGTTYTITPGAKGDTGKVPVMSINNGEWYVDYQDGKGPQSLGVKATGENGKTPVFRVYQGFWQMRYVEDGPDAAYTNVKDADGNDVPATTEGSGSSAFSGAEISEDGTMFIVTVPTDTGERQIKLPIVPDFLVEIARNNGAAYEDGCYLFNHGDKYSFDVTIKGAAEIKLDAPASFVAELDDKDDNDATTYSLNVSAIATKAIVASTETDVTITITSDSYGSAMAKIRVKLVEGTIELHPSATVTAGEAAENSLVFNVALTDAVSYKYILKTKEEAAPTAADFEALTAETKEALTIESLAELTQYVLYVLPLDKNGVAGEIASAESSTTTNATGLYKEYLLGNDITIAGKTINKAIYGPAKMVKEDIVLNNLENTYVYFVQAGKTIDYNVVQTADPTKEDSVKELIIIGNDEGRGNLNILSRIIVRKHQMGRSPLILFDNINIDATKYNNYTITSYHPADDYKPEFVFNNCNISINNTVDFISLPGNDDKRGIKSLTMAGCDYRINIVPGSDTATKTLFLLNCKNDSGIDEISFTNNVFYCSEQEVTNLRFRFVDAASEKVNKIVFTENTVVELLTDGFGSAGSAFFNSADLTSMEVNNNLLYSTTLTKAGYFYRTTSADKDAIHAALKESTSANFDKTTIYYYAPSGLNWSVVFGAQAAEYDGKLIIYKKADSPFESIDVANGVFTKAANCTQGAQR